MCDSIKFSVLCSLFNWMQKSKSSSQKRSKFRKFLDHYCKPGDYFGAIRLILPALDRERGSYGFKESVLATCLVDAVGMSRDSDDAVRLFNWRKGGPKTGANAGNFASVATEVLQRRQGITSGGLTVKQLNDLLDCLASRQNRVEKTSVLADMIQRTNASEMKWIIMIILKDLKLGISEKSIFHEFHPDAEDLFNVTCDLKLVCEKLWDRSQRHKRQDIEVGKPVRPQLAMRISSASAAWKKLHGKEVVLECKFDGDRIQVHKNGVDVHFFSRNFLDHSEYSHAISNVIIENIQVDRCILDGEMLVWDTSQNRFAEFGANQEIAKAAREGLDSERQESLDVAFDILYAGDSSVIHQSLKERQELLRKVVKPLKGHLEILVPDVGLNNYRHPGEPCWSILAHNVDAVEKFFKEIVENRDEGIVLKDLGSKWEPSDRSGKWLKLKPEYIRAGADLDVLIIGGYYGSGRHGGQVAQFLVGLAEKSSANTYPRRFISFCRVGTGLSDDELDELVSKLKPHFRENEPKKSAPSFYQVTNNSKERPDVWIENPEKSIILSITSDIRTIRSEVFSAPYSLRFPRIDRVRYDKPWHECLDVQSFIELVHSSNNTTQRTDYGSLPNDKPKRVKSLKKGDKKKFQIIPSHFMQTDVSNVKDESSIFSNFVFYFVNTPPNYSLDSLHKLVIENGGTFSMNLNDKVTHCIAAESKGIKYKAAQCYGDVIHYSWVLECCLQKQLLYLQPKYFIFLSEATKKQLQDEIDEFCDSYFSDLSVAEFKQILPHVRRFEDIRTVEYYKKKFWPRKWHLLDCCIYFHLMVQFCAGDWRVLLELESRRMKVEVRACGGKISSTLSQATHLVVLSAPGFDLQYETFLESLSTEERHVLHKKRLHIVQVQWLEDCLKTDQRLPEVKYSLKPNVLEEANLIEYCDPDDPSMSVFPVSKDKPVSIVESRAHVKPTNRDPKRKRGRPVGKGTRTKKPVSGQPRRAKAWLGSRPAKIYEEEPSTSDLDVKVDQVDTPSGDGSRILDDDVNSAITEDKAVKGSGFLHNAGKSKLDEYMATANDKEGQSSRIEECDASNRRDATNSGKLEMMLDPLQAMLLDMIPSLGMENSGKGLAVTAEKLPVDSKLEYSVHPDLEMPKKKKISYKDLAGELLKD